MPKELACTKCRYLTTETTCPVCGSRDLSPNWSGLLYVLDPEKSELAKMIGAKVPGRYAVKVT
jgi:DNA-directed RNA polymerase subunit E"